MDHSISFHLTPTPVCRDTLLAKSRPTREILAQIQSLIKPEPALTAMERLPGIFGYTCKGSQVKTFGKGFNSEQAMTSALMEQWERSHWNHYPFMSQPGYRVATFAQLFRQQVSLVPAAYFLFNLADPDHWANYLPQVGEIPLHWLPAWSFSHDQPTLYPVNWHNICYTTNGLATGANVSEALLQGVCEVVERENIWRWLAEGATAPLVDPDSINDDDCQQLIARAAECGVKIIIRDTSLTCQIPCYSVYGCFNYGDHQEYHFSAAGHGCHPTPLLALKRALSEYLASHYICQEASGNSPGLWSGPLPAMPPLTALRDPSAILANCEEIIPLATSSEYESDDLTNSFYLIQKALTKDGYDVAARLLNPGEPFPVIRVIIPCMRALLGTEIEEYLMILAQVAYEGGQADKSMEFIADSFQQPNSAISQYLGNNPMLTMLLPTILRQMGPNFFFGKTYQDSFEKFDSLSKPGNNFGALIGSLLG